MGNDSSILINKDDYSGLSGYIILPIEAHKEIKDILFLFDSVFTPSLSKRITDLDKYAEKLYNNAYVYSAISEDILGFIAFYANDLKTNMAYLTQIAVRSTYKNRGIGKSLLDKCIDISKLNGMSKLKLEVLKCNGNAIQFYKGNGFKFCDEASSESMYMVKNL